MRTEIVTVSNEHFEWRTNEKGEPYKFKLSDKIITKQVKVTYDDQGKEINREAYVETPSPALAAWAQATPEEKKKLADDLKKYL